MGLRWRRGVTSIGKWDPGEDASLGVHDGHGPLQQAAQGLGDILQAAPLGSRLREDPVDGFRTCDGRSLFGKDDAMELLGDLGEGDLPGDLEERQPRSLGGITGGGRKVVEEVWHRQANRGETRRRQGGDQGVLCRRIVRPGIAERVKPQ